MTNNDKCSALAAYVAAYLVADDGSANVVPPPAGSAPAQMTLDDTELPANG